ncbi:hypothetical protein M0R72_12805 [Candidatus Pacearchaeota archaeon]|jgi:hypothetical protein|nr:hypothetical protein [Candidatus Pacearchaeota archaeon]
MARTLYVNPASTLWSTAQLGTASEGPYTLDKDDVLTDDIIDLNGVVSPFEFDANITAGKIIDTPEGTFCQIKIDNGVVVTSDYGDYSVSGAIFGVLVPAGYGTTSRLVGDWDAGPTDVDNAAYVLETLETDPDTLVVIEHCGGFNGVENSTLIAGGMTVRLFGNVTQPAGWVAQYIWSNLGHGGTLSGSPWIVSNYGSISFTMTDSMSSTWPAPGSATSPHIYNMSAAAQVCLSLTDYNTTNKPWVHPFALPATQVLYGINRYDGTVASSGEGTLGTVTLPNTDGSTPDASLVKSTANFGAGNATAGTLDMGLYELVTAGDTRVANQLTTDQGVVSAAKASIIANANILGQNDGTYPTTAATQAADAATLTAAMLNADGTDTTISFGASNGTAKSGAVFTAGRAAQLVTDQGAVDGQKAFLQRPADGGPASLLSVVGTLNTAALQSAAAAAQLVTDTAAATADVAKILSTATNIASAFGVTGTYHAPSLGEVIDTAVFGAASAEHGTYHCPTTSEVLAGVMFGAGSVQQGTAVAVSADATAGSITQYRYSTFVATALTVATAQTGDSHALLVYAPGNKSTVLWSLTTAGGEISVGGTGDKTITLSDTDAHTGTPGKFACVLKNTTDDVIVWTGYLTIVDCPQVPSV